ncbi:MAG: tRNA (N(6)-L-threonylcarbamoyladenosine(37)-C(2))-methylthiotransferase MtaB [Ignavibacteriaceae bacterium]|nr:tRNA (N(6)-L-threonylcarbamoyladenosine(37)-C(2))-methylthiotransferase MtaB [Ignavibacteriaceae bacterium]
MQKKVALHTLGCKLNYSETSSIGNQFLERNFEVVDFQQEADVYVLNTCSVTESAERECRQIIRRALRQNPQAFIIITGCYAQLRPDEIAQIDGVDAVLGSNEKFKLFSLIDNFKKRELTCISVTPTENLTEFGVAHSTDADNRTRAFLKVQDGCDYTCSFCTIPLARGASRSLPVNNVVEEFKKLLIAGYKEIVLTGVNVGDYGKNIGTNLFNLLSELIKVEDEFRIRISSIEPNLLTDEIINLVAESEKLCNHFHIPLQSGSSKILRAMQRRYTIDDYQNLISKLKTRLPDAGIGIDVIVGFPGETEEDFIQTHNFLRDLPISYLHVFTYSERPDTKAISLPGVVDVQERKRRNNILRILSEKKRAKFYSDMIGTKQSVIFENADKNGLMHSFTSNYIKVQAEYNDALTGQICPIILTGSNAEICTGEVISTKKSVDLIPS